MEIESNNFAYIFRHQLYIIKLHRVQELGKGLCGEVNNLIDPET